MSKPNILYIHSHDTGRYIQPYGHAVATPHLQRLAAQGVLFRQGFCANPTCSASRACLVTGQYAHVNGMVGLAHRGFSLNDYSHHIIHTLHEAGYTSILAHVQHVAGDTPGHPGWRTIGYNQYLGHEDAHEHAAAFLENGPAEPFFLSVGFIETHREFPPADQSPPAAFVQPPLPLPDTPETRQDMARFHASAAVLDAKIGTVLDALDRSGLAENTLVICTTDHGIAFPRMKCNLTDGGIGVMLIMRGPGGFAGGAACDAMVTHMDLFPTICDVAGITPPDRLQGRSLLPLIRGEVDELHEAIFAEVNYHAAYEPQRCVRTKRHKYIRRYGGRERVVLPNCDDSPSKDVWIAAGWPDLQAPSEVLYDLAFDPHETANIIANPAFAPVAADMRRRLDTWMRVTDDPLLAGPVPAPPGAVVNDPDGLSPTEPPRLVGQSGNA